MPNLEDGILRSLRRLTRAIDLYSRHLSSSVGLTGPQLVCLQRIGQCDRIAPSGLAKDVELSQATVTGIVDRLESRGLVLRERSAEDRRRVALQLTAEGRALLDGAPSPLQDRFLARLRDLSEAEQQTIHSTLQRVVEMMGAEELEAAPVLLDAGPLEPSPRELSGLLDTAPTPT